MTKKGHPKKKKKSPYDTHLDDAEFRESTTTHCWLILIKESTHINKVPTTLSSRRGKTKKKVCGVFFLGMRQMVFFGGGETYILL